MRGDPLGDCRLFVGGVVVADEVQVQLGGRVFVDRFQEFQEFLVAVSPMRRVTSPITVGWT